MTVLRANDQARADALELTLSHAPDTLADAELQQLQGLAAAIATSTPSIVPSDAFRNSARARLLARMVAMTITPRHQRSGWRERSMIWFARLAGGLTALSVAGAGVASASASALPGDMLYGVKEAAEVLELRLAPNDAVRAQLLISQTDTRLEETARLTHAGRLRDVADSAQRYDEALGHVLDIVSPSDAENGQQSRAELEAKLQAHTAQLNALLADAPVQARPGLERARDASSRGLTRAADVRGQTPPAPPQPGSNVIPTATAIPGAHPTPPPTAPSSNTPDQHARDSDGNSAADVDESDGPSTGTPSRGLGQADMDHRVSGNGQGHDPGIPPGRGGRTSPPGGSSGTPPAGAQSASTRTERERAAPPQRSIGR